MFVVQRTQTPTTPDTTRTTLRQNRVAAQQRQRNAPESTFSLTQPTASRVDTSTGVRGGQNPVTSNVPTANSTSVSANTSGNLEASGVGMQKLLDTMKQLGMSTSGLNISYSEDFIGYPGGGYMNKSINVTANGKTERFNAELTDRNPMVTANELQIYFGVTPTASASGTTRQG